MTKLLTFGLLILAVAATTTIAADDPPPYKITTKRDNALYEGYSAGMGLGLSFVAVVLEHHGAKLEIESAPHRGTTFRMRFPLTA